MQIRDLGELNGPVLIYGGPYSNAPATRALFDTADALGIPVSHRICTGDVVAYGAGVSETIDHVRKRGGVVVAGNCEKQLGAGAEGCGCGFEAGTVCDTLSGAWYAHAMAQCSEADRAWMRTCPDIVTFDQAEAKVAVIHGGVTDVARFLWETSPSKAFAEEVAALTAQTGPVDIVLAGHSGLPFQRDVAGVRWINAGVIGMPPHDGHPATRYAVLDNAAARIMPLAYDIAQAVAEMEAAGLTQGYHTALRSGWWPSEDVLPLELRRPVAKAVG